MINFCDEVALTGTVRFRHFELCPGSRELIIDGKPAELGSRAFDLLTLLVAHRDRVLNKKELMAALWPGMVVEENNLQIHVSALRKLIGAAAIATVQGRGYRFALDPVVHGEDAVVSALPALPGKLYGRQTDLHELTQLIDAHPVVTVVGPGGIGKSTLALAATHAAGVERGATCYWVDLARLPPGADAAQVAGAIANAAGLPVPAEGVVATVAEALRARTVLLVLDNAEHLAAGTAACVHALTRMAGAVRVLTTSQVPLHLQNERVLRLDALGVPPVTLELSRAIEYGAVALFVDRARAVDRQFSLTPDNLETVIKLCQQLDGLPLALRLAAARLPVLGLDGVAQRLGDSLQLLRSRDHSGLRRQHTMEAALDWSFGLLADDTQQLFCRLGVFVGGFTLESAELIAADLGDHWHIIDQLDELTDRSLLTMQTDACGQLRYRIPECARQYAWRQLQQRGDAARCQRAHATGCRALIERAYDDYWQLPDREWLRRYEPDLDNVRHALHWAGATDPMLALRIVAGCGPLFMLLGLAPEARRRYAGAAGGAELAEMAPTLTGGTDLAAACARYWLERSRLEWGVSNREMLAYASKAEKLYRALDDSRGVFLALRCAAAAAVTTDPPAAAPMLEEMKRLARPNWSIRLHTQLLLTEAAVCQARSQMAEAGVALQALVEMGEQAGLEGIASAAHGALAALRLQEGEQDAALYHARCLLERSVSHRGNFLLHAHGVSATVWLFRGELGQSRTALVEFARLSRLRGWEWLGLYGDVFALLAGEEGRCADAMRILGFADAARERLGARDRIASEAHQRTLTLCAPQDQADLHARLHAQGRALSDAAVCQLALGPDWDQQCARVAASGE